MQRNPMNMQQPLFLRVFHTQATNLAGITNLASHLSIERRTIKDDVHVVSIRAGHDSLNHGLSREIVKTNECRRCNLQVIIGHINGRFLALMIGAGAGSLFFHQDFETRHVNRQATFACH